MYLNEKLSKVCNKVWQAIGRVGYSVTQSYNYCVVTPRQGGKQNYAVKQWLDKAGDCVQYLKAHFPVKYVQSSYGQILFWLDDSKIIATVEQEIADAKAKRLAHLNAIDLTPYTPTQKVIDKLTDYFIRGSKVNCGAIKDNVKFLTYYYAAYELGWGDLKSWLSDSTTGRWGWKAANGESFDDIRAAIELRVRADGARALNRTKDEERLLSLSRKVYQAITEADLDFDLTMVRPTLQECWKDQRNGCACTIAYELTVGDKRIRFSDVTNEGGGTFGYQFYPIGELMTKGEFETKLLRELSLA